MEGAHGPNIVAREGSVTIGTSDQSGYREPKDIIRSPKSPSPHENVSGLHLENPEQKKKNGKTAELRCKTQGLLQQFFQERFLCPVILSHSKAIRAARYRCSGAEKASRVPF